MKIALGAGYNNRDEGSRSPQTPRRETGGGWGGGGLPLKSTLQTADEVRSPTEDRGGEREKGLSLTVVPLLIAGVRSRVHRRVRTMRR